MPSVYVPLPVPQVPIVPGVPALPIALLGVPPLPPGFAVALPSLITSDTAGIISAVRGGQWGIFDSNGNAVLQVDAVDSIEYARDYRVSDYTQENGAFQSYNKVQVPYEAKVGFLISDARVEFLNTVEAVLASLELFFVVTPEVSYASSNLIHYGYRRVSRNGVTLMRVEVWCEEIRVSATTTLANAQSNNGLPTQQNGTIQPQVVLPAGTNSGATSGNVNPNIDPSFYSPTNTPLVSSSWSSLTSAQQQTVGALGTSTGAASATVTAPDENGNVLANFSSTSIQ